MQVFVQVQLKMYQNNFFVYLYLIIHLFLDFFI